MKKITSKLFLMIMLFMMSGCTPAVSPVIANTTCEAPCWRNIRPGFTTKEELISILNIIPEVDSEDILIHSEGYKIFDSIVSIQLTEDIEIDIYVINNVVADIIFSGKNLATFEQAVEKYGEPVYILNISAMAEGFLFGDALHGYIMALLPKKGIVYGYDTYYVPKSTRENIAPETELSWIYFFDNARYEELLDAGMFSMSTPAELARNSMRPWMGYGSLEELYYP